MTFILLLNSGERGENSYIGRYSILEAHENCKIVIGKNCAIGPHVKIYTAGRITD